MKLFRLGIIIFVLSILLAACGSGGGNNSPFPIPNNNKNLFTTGESANFQSTDSMEGLVAFYRGELIDKQGLTERGLLTVINENAVSMVFDGHTSGQPIVLQMVVLPDGDTNVNIRFEDV